MSTTEHRLAQVLHQAYPRLSDVSIKVLTEGLVAIADRAAAQGWDLTDAQLVLRSSDRGNQLASSLRRLRAATGMTQTEVAGRLDFSLSKMMRIESGQVGVNPGDLNAFMDLYGVRDAATRERLHELRRAWRDRDGRRGTRPTR